MSDLELKHSNLKGEDGIHQIHAFEKTATELTTFIPPAGSLHKVILNTTDNKFYKIDSEAPFTHSPMGGGGGGSTGGVSVHDDLTGRDAEDQHPIAAITGLVDELTAIKQSIIDGGGTVVDPEDPEENVSTAYGLAWDSNTDTYARIGTEDYLPIQKKMKRCVLNVNGTVNYYLHPTNSTLKEDNSPANLTGADGNVMVEIPAFYVRYTTTGSQRKMEVKFGAEAGFTLHPAFIKAGVEVPFRYYRAYKGHIKAGKLLSISGVEPTRSQTIAQFRTQAEANGAGWHQLDWNLLQAVKTLLFVEIGTLDSQSVLGDGNVSGSNYGKTTGASNSIGNGSTTTPNTAFMSYRGIENFYGEAYEAIDGVNFKEGVVYTNGNHTTFASDVFTGDYVTTGVTLPATGFIKDMSFTTKGIIPTASGGSATTFAADYVYKGTGDTVGFHGGTAGSGAAAGASYLYARYAASYSNADLGAGLVY